MTRALVLSGGGPVGIAWQTGLAGGLASKGVDLAAADFIVGTSAGSAVGALLALGHDLDARLEEYRSRATPPTQPAGATRTAPPPERMQKLMQVMAGQQGATAEERMAAIGRFALEADTPREDRFLAGFQYLASDEWPDGYACTAVEAETGRFVVWDKAAGVPLDRAVASSCAVPGVFPPITINGKRYIDGGMRSGSNADLATGHDKVLLVSLMSAQRASANPSDPRIARYRARMERERAALEEAGSALELVGPDEGAAQAIGTNLMDNARAKGAAEAGFRQGEGIASTLAGFWC